MHRRQGNLMGGYSPWIMVISPISKKAVEDFLSDQEGNIPRGKVLSVGSMLLILGVLLADQARAAHGSHVSHGSHGSHESHTSGSHHVSHASHSSVATTSKHVSHSSHVSSITSPKSVTSTPAPSTPAPSAPSANHSNTAPTIAALNDIKTPDVVVAPKLPNMPSTEIPPDTTPAS